MITLYHDYASSNSQKVRLYLAEHNIPWQDASLVLMKQEHLRTEYLAINPNGLVPALKDGDKVVVNSTDIMQYLKDHYAENEFDDSTLNEEIYDFCKLGEALHDPYLRILSYYYLWMKAKKSEDEVTHIIEQAKQHPNKERGVFLQRAVRKQFTTKDIEQARNKVIDYLDEAENLLSNSTSGFIISDHYTMADCSTIATLCRIKRMHFEQELSQHSALLNYYEAMQQRPNFTAAKVY